MLKHKLICYVNIDFVTEPVATSQNVSRLAILTSRRPNKLYGHLGSSYHWPQWSCIISFIGSNLTSATQTGNCQLSTSEQTPEGVGKATSPHCCVWKVEREYLRHCSASESAPGKVTFQNLQTILKTGISRDVSRQILVSIFRGSDDCKPQRIKTWLIVSPLRSKIHSLVELNEILASIFNKRAHLD